ncbi:helix-turn-helix domain-containing protein [Carboxydothermus hydrogenoformans]|uniref:Cytoskeleton protein RodZ-like C-terminal domain-containing protein n=1 Tax=Carboxydothermus hydrogenoformans (strain ATCC BAA-161 / DSM 6008 / Z-2901) TaxID=246194 RepID=Q3ACX6_CARHZ|nr:RodZ domain-containing protein [Carboxydothermus hydrogenoformans]ABB15938.1 conserved hypothetical protein [Carboxydothermus hydrogenoformans Z-2901]
MIGEKLRKRREQLGLTIKQVEEEIKIRSKYLQALEEERFDELPGKAYIKPFLQSYARFLGVTIEPEDLPTIVVNTEQSISEQTKQVKAFKEEKKFFLPLKTVFITLFFLIITSALVYTFISGRITKEPSKAIKPPVPGKVYQKQSQRVLPVKSFEKTIIVRAVYGPCWLEVKEEDKVVFTGKINPPAEKQFISTKPVNIKFGNAGAVVVTVNGVTYGTPGKMGQVVKITY